MGRVPIESLYGPQASVVVRPIQPFTPQPQHHTVDSGVRCTLLGPPTPCLQSYHQEISNQQRPIAQVPMGHGYRSSLFVATAAPLHGHRPASSVASGIMAPPPLPTVHQSYLPEQQLGHGGKGLATRSIRSMQPTRVLPHSILYPGGGNSQQHHLRTTPIHPVVPGHRTTWQQQQQTQLQLQHQLQYHYQQQLRPQPQQIQPKASFKYPHPLQRGQTS